MDEMPSRHPRAGAVRRATGEIHDVLNQWRITYTTSDVQMLLALNAIESDVLHTLAGESRTGVVGPYGGLTLDLMQVQQQHDLTTVELLQALLLFGVEMSNFLLRQERHPDDPDKRAGEA